MKGLLSVLLAAAALAACDDGTGIRGDTGEVTVQFAASPAATGAASLGTTAVAEAGTVVIAGAGNDTLRITDLRVIVAELELEGSEGACEVAGDDDECPDFEAGATFVDLPLDGTPFEIATADIPFGSYSELEFEVEDIELDDDEEDEQQLQALREQVRAAFPQWPEEASMVAVGEFKDGETGQVRPFTVFFEAEIEVEMDLNPPLVISETGASRTLTVLLDPAMWFTNSDATVRDLSEWDFEATGTVVEFELELEDGFTEIEFGD